jgi:hypothetical protein
VKFNEVNNNVHLVMKKENNGLCVKKQKSRKWRIRNAMEDIESFKHTKVIYKFRMNTILSQTVNLEAKHSAHTKKVSKFLND